MAIVTISAIDEAELKFQPLKVEDRCDSCNAAARVSVLSTKTGLYFLLCAHHVRKHIQTLVSQGCWIFGDTEGSEITEIDNLSDLW